MTIGLLYHHTKKELSAIYDTGEAEAIAGLVIAHYTGLDKMERSRQQNQEADAAAIQQCDTALEQLLLHRPLQYVLGEAWFYGLKFFVNEHVLIPRPETEELVDEVIKWLRSNRNGATGCHVLDIGTGSGCIPAAIKHTIPDATVSAIDISSEALSIAKKNADDLRAAIHFLQFDFLDETKWNELGQYDVIVSNPPYIPLNEKAKLDRNVTEWEPATALFVPDNGPLLFYRKIAAFGHQHLRKDGKIFLECHQDYASQTLALFVTEDYSAELRKDMHGNDRMIVAGRKVNWS